MNTAVDTYVTTVTDWLAVNGLAWGFRIVGALLVFLIGRWVTSLLLRWLDRGLARGNVETTLARFISRLAGVMLLVVVVLASLDLVGIRTTSVVAIIGAAGLAIGLALQKSLSNFAAGVMIILFKPFRVGNFIDAGGIKGIAEEISIFHTILRTPDNLQVIVPNSRISEGPITNFSAKPTRRIDLTIGVSYRDDLKVAQAAIRRVVEGNPNILTDPAPVIGTDNLGASAVEIVVRVWVKSPDFLTTKFYLVEHLKTELEQAGCSIAYPQQDVHLYPVPERPVRIESSAGKSAA
jgi:small conductance mechanosensitive channel